MPNVLVNELKRGLLECPKKIPCSYLYDERGSELYEKITELEEYYPFLAEEKLLKQNAEDIASHFPPQCVVVELGCGTARKTALILRSLVARDGSCRFAGIDVSAPFLEEARINLMKHVSGLKFGDIELIQAEYLEGLKEARKRFPQDHLCILWLGSSVGNLTDDQIVDFFRSMEAAAGPNMRIFLCADLWKDTEVLRAAYDDKYGITEAFIKNGLRNAVESLKGSPLPEETVSEWVYEVEINSQLRRVEMWVRIPNGLNLNVACCPNFRQNDKVLVEISRKFTVDDLMRLALRSSFCIHAAWRTKQYGMQIILPAATDLKLCWEDTDRFFEGIPNWFRKPIDVRHPFVFYYGHVAAFSKLKLFPDEENSEMDIMFSRGIDPLMFDNSKCHAHPEVPPEWPSKAATKAYVEAVRNRIMKAATEMKLSMRSVMLALEHERMHQETLHYMKVQEIKEEFEKMENRAPPLTPMADPISQTVDSKSFVSIGAGKVVMGTNEEDTGFVWDNEMPRSHGYVSDPFMVQTFPVSVAEFRHFVLHLKGYQNSEWWDAEDFDFFSEKKQVAPATWSFQNGEIYVHSERETRHWSEVAHEPVMVSLSEARAYCKAHSARLMTEEEWHRIADSDEGGMVMGLRCGGWEWTNSIFQPFHGFTPMPDYPEYSADFFDGLHYVLKGASQVTHPSLRRDSYRNFFQRQYPYVFAKFRMCRGL